MLRSIALCSHPVIVDIVSSPKCTWFRDKWLSALIRQHSPIPPVSVCCSFLLFTSHCCHRRKPSTRPGVPSAASFWPLGHPGSSRSSTSSYRCCRTTNYPLGNFDSWRGLSARIFDHLCPEMSDFFFTDLLPLFYHGFTHLLCFWLRHFSLWLFVSTLVDFGSNPLHNEIVVVFTDV